MDTNHRVGMEVCGNRIFRTKLGKGQANYGLICKKSGRISRSSLGKILNLCNHVMPATYIACLSIPSFCSFQKELGLPKKNIMYQWNLPLKQVCPI